MRQPVCSRERVCAAENMTRHIVRTVCTDLCTHTQRSGLRTQDSGPRTQDPKFRTHNSRLTVQDSGSELKTQNSRLRDQDSDLRTQEFSFLTTQDGEGVARPPGQEDTVRVSGIRNQESGQEAHHHRHQTMTTRDSAPTDYAQPLGPATQY